MQVAQIQQKIAKHRLQGELAILSKQESIRNRVNKALGKTPDALKQATGDLRNRLTTVVGAGLQGEARFGGKKKLEACRYRVQLRNRCIQADA